MAFVLETGAGTPGANAYATPAFVTTYLTDRNRETEQSWSTVGTPRQQEAIVVATDYLEKRFAGRFKGTKRRRALPGRAAYGRITFASVPLNAEVVVAGQKTYRFVATLAQEDDVLIGADVAASLANLIAAVQGDATARDVTVHEDTLANFEVSAKLNADDASTLDVTADLAGENGNEITFTTTITGATITGSGTLGSGLDAAPQPLSFPRSGLRGPDGESVQGVPLKVKQAVAEYAVRSLAATLDPDLTVDASGARVQKRRERVGPIEEEFEFSEGAQPVIHRPYPAADRLLADFILAGGRVVR